jgi:hypothetical protein
MRVGGRARGKQGLAASNLGGADLPERAWKVFDVVNAKIEHADIKAGAILGACGVAAAATIGLITSRSDQGALLTAAAVTTGIFILMAATFSCGALWPRRLQSTSPESLLYFDHIARRAPASPGPYENELRVLLADPDALSCEIIKQVWATSHVAAKKYDFIDRAMICLFGALITLVATGVIFAVHYRGY